jgi:hypothetical protein
MSNPPLRARTFGNTAESRQSGIPACERYAGTIWAFKRAGGVDAVGDMTYRLERTTPTA